MATWKRSACAVFYRVREEHGLLSNMAGGMPLCVGNVEARTSEALYQACRFPHLPEVQHKIFAQKSPMAAKMVGKPHAHESRADWNDVRVPIMLWCLRVKLLQHRNAFGGALRATRDRDIVEQSRRDRFWGAVPSGDDELCGDNTLGTLLVRVRTEMTRRMVATDVVDPPSGVDDLRLCGESIASVRSRSLPSLWTI